MLKEKLGWLVRRFARERSGNVAIIFGAAIVPIILALGVGIDYGRAFLVKERMSEATDAAGLAIGSWVDLDEDTLKEKAQTYFDANYPSSTIGTASNVDVQFIGDDILLTVTGKVPTTFMRLADINDVDVSAQSLISRQQQNIELVLVLDTTGSMKNSGKMTALKSAAKEMVNTLFSSESTSDTLKIGVVPFSAAVNVGTSNKNASWIDDDSKSSIASEDLDLQSGETILGLFDELHNDSWGGCVRERAEPYELTDTAPTSSDKDTLFSPYLAPDEPDETESSCSGWYCRGGSNSDYYNSYLDDEVPEECTKSGWRGETCEPVTEDPEEIQRLTNKYADDGYVSDGDPNFNCTASPLTDLTNRKTTIIDAINDLSPEGSTVIPAGLLWGWRVLSPTAPFTEGAEYSDDDVVKAMVLLTDGENSVGGGSNEHNESYYNAFGYAAEGHLGSTSGYQAEDELDEKTLEVCDNIKATGIRLYTIGFQVSTSVQNLLQSCASESDMFYNSPSNSELASVFQDIAQGLGDLRVAR
ncbi:pilus assembly protein [Methyloligella sp. 2.7D]|uniref:pilus assembly protein n=1 Tax=unclassified Methyloligella TaxID=2625955 RepID=UPI00157C3538|nr:pilus assembly protein [Methyloligella sp. GL2]QKP78592.1 VWA domain-containing protein [Methyloligella sp. GL2]